MSDCFGMISVFCASSNVCRACDAFSSCAVACQGELQQLSSIGDISKYLCKHEAAMEKIGLIKTKDKKIPRKKRTKQLIKTVKKKSAEYEENTGLEANAQSLLNKLLEEKVLDIGWIASNIEASPDFFRYTVEAIKNYGEIKSKDLVKSIQCKVDKDEATVLPLVAMSVQVLNHCKLIEVGKQKRTQVIKWKTPLS